ncbi:MAG: hypothetical protein GYB38_05785 [Gammaproteobacteria bacterium]|nr:hypothetical protein [Gammaproteobacteria bacterium]
MKVKYGLMSALLFPFFGLAADIDTLFPYAAQSHSADGEIDMSRSSKINGTRDGKLDFRKKEELNGRCDGYPCGITHDVAPAFSLPAFNHHPLDLPDFKTTFSGRNATCSGSGSITYSQSEYKSVKASGSCDVHLANDGDVVIREDMSASGSADLYLEAGNYWMDSFSLSGSSNLIVTTPGEVNLYVKDEVKLAGGSPLGSIDAPVNLIHYDDDDIELNGGLTWYGDFSSMADLKITGSSKLYGAFQARSLELIGSTRLYQTTGDYWFDDVKLSGSARLLPVGNSVTRLYIRDELELGGSTELGSDGQPLLVLVYGDEGDHDGEVDLEGSSEIYGHLYIQGELEMGGSTRINGAVNVVDLQMGGSSAINYRELEILVPNVVHHYELDFNTCSGNLTVKACGDASCSADNLYSDKATVHVKNQGHPPKDLYKFKDFNGQASTSISKEANQLNYSFELGYHTTGNGNLSPKPENDLVCYVDGIRTCKVNGQSNTSGSGPLTLDIDTAYVAGNAPIQFSGNCLASNATVDMEFGFDSSTSGFAGPVIIRWPSGSKTLSAGQKSVLTLPVSGATLSYPRADLLTLSARQMLPDGGYAGKGVTDQVAFVPAYWEVQQGVNCGDNSGFKYNDHAESCTVLGVAGEPIDFAVAALDFKGDQLPLEWLQSQQGLKKIIEANLESANEIKTEAFDINNTGSLSQHQLNAWIVGRIGIKVENYTAKYIPDNDSQLVTKEHNAFVGRTIPASLKVIATAGDIEDDVVYAGKPGVIFDTAPSFTVVGLDVNGNELASYSGEFAGGLKGNTTLELDTALDLEILAPTIAEAETGKHVISVDTSKVKFSKTEPFAETGLNLPLELTIKDHDGTAGVDNEETILAQESDTLRFGFVTLMDTEIKVGEAGTMASKLRYFGQNLQTVREDDKSVYSLQEAGSLSHTPVESALQLSLVEHEVTVAAYDKQQKNIKVTIENLPDWLKPERDGSLVHPEARLDILNQPRRRANDSTFNRREVSR